MKSDDELLDEVIARFRLEEAPEPPAALFRAAAEMPARIRIWRLVGAGAIAASVAALLMWRFQAAPVDDPRGPEIARRPVTQNPVARTDAQPVDLTKPFAEMEASLDAVDAEVAALRNEAALLDARRMADEMLAKY